MNRCFRQLFHSTVQSSYLRAVEPLWNLCQTGWKLETRSRIALISGASESDFSHEGWMSN